MDGQSERTFRGGPSRRRGDPTLQAADLPEEVARYLFERECVPPDQVRVIPLEGDASDRAYFRLVLDAPRAGFGGSYVIMKLASPWTPCGDWHELPFVNIARHLRSRGVCVPRVLVDASGDGFLLLEDVGDMTLEQYLRGCSPAERRRRYEQAIDLLVKMQNGASGEPERPCYALGYRFDAQTFLEELRFFRKHAIEGLWGHRLSEQERCELDGHFRRLCLEICRYPQVFTHRDYHSRNLMVRREGLTVLDFQDARIGPITYDLASLLKDSYVRLSREEQEELISFYRMLALRSGLAEAGLEGFTVALVRTGIQRNLKAIGTFAYQAVVKGVDRYLPYVENTIRSLREAFESDPEWRSFRRILGSYVPGL